MADNTKENKDSEGQTEAKIPYPKSVFLIIATEFCERFSYYGMRTVLSLYFRFLGYEDETSTVLFHAFVSLCYFAPILGATLADSFLGKFRTIFYLCLVYILGELVLTLGAVGDDPEQGIPGMPAGPVSFIGLLLIAIGTGGIKPCVAPFGAEQFELPQQEAEMKTFFSWFYASINSGALISTILTPYLRSSGCLGQDTCFPLAFGVPSALMVVALCFFVLGKVFNLYTIRMPDENIIVKTVKCIWHGFSEWRKRRSEKLESILDYSKGRFGEQFVEDVKALKGVVWVFLPVPVFWSLFDQQGSTWTFQATRMRSRIGEDFELLPDTIQVANAVLILLFIPLFDFVIYPLFAKIKLFRTPLQRIVVGGLLAGGAFFISGFIELKLQQSYPVMPAAGNGMFTFYNGFHEDCTLPSFDIYEKSEGKFVAHIDFKSTLELKNQTYMIKPNGTKTFECGGKTFTFEEKTIEPFPSTDSDIESEADAARTIIFTADAVTGDALIYYGETLDKYEKPKDGYPFLKFFWNIDYDKNVTIQIKDLDGVEVHKVILSKESDDRDVFNGTNTLGDISSINLETTGKMDIVMSIDGAAETKTRMDFFYGGNYQTIIQKSKDATVNENVFDKIRFYEITTPNDFHMLWQLPQYVVITAGEIMFSITTLSFAFTEAPVSMKSVMMAVQNLTVAFGDLIVIILIPILASLIGNQAYIFFFFASLMVADMALMAFMTRNYEYRDATNRALSQGK